MWEPGRRGPRALSPRAAAATLRHAALLRAVRVKAVAQRERLHSRRTEGASVHIDRRATLIEAVGGVFAPSLLSALADLRASHIHLARRGLVDAFRADALPARGVPGLVDALFIIGA